MRRIKILFLFITIALFIVGVTQSCQGSDNDFYTSEIELTAADIFVASEAYQNLQKQTVKCMKARKNAISKLTEEELKRYYKLMDGSYNAETCGEALKELNVLLGPDYETRRDQLLTLTIDVYKNTNFTQLELIKARQKYQMNIVTIRTRSSNAELLAKCIEECAVQCKEYGNNCFIIFKDAYDNLPPNEIADYSPAYQHIIWVYEQCMEHCYIVYNSCVEICKKLYGSSDND